VPALNLKSVGSAEVEEPTSPPGGTAAELDRQLNRDGLETPRDSLITPREAGAAMSSGVKQGSAQKGPRSSMAGSRKKSMLAMGEGMGCMPYVGGKKAIRWADEGDEATSLEQHIDEDEVAEVVAPEQTATNATSDEVQFEGSQDTGGTSGEVVFKSSDISKLMKNWDMHHEMFDQTYGAGSAVKAFEQQNKMRIGAGLKPAKKSKGMKKVVGTPRPKEGSPQKATQPPKAMTPRVPSAAPRRIHQRRNSQ